MKKKIFPINYACMECNKSIFVACVKCGEKLSYGHWTRSGGVSEKLLQCEKHGFIKVPECDCGENMIPFDGTSKDF